MNYLNLHHITSHSLGLGRHSLLQTTPNETCSTSEQMMRLLCIRLLPARQLPKISCAHSKHSLEVRVKETEMQVSCVAGSSLRRQSLKSRESKLRGSWERVLWSRSDRIRRRGCLSRWCCRGLLSDDGQLVQRWPWCQ